MTRTVPGSGAKIEPLFNSIFGVRDVYVVDGGSGLVVQTILDQQQNVVNKTHKQLQVV